MALKGKSSAFLPEWLASVGLIQADLCKELGWSKAKANAVWNHQQRYNEDMLAEIASLVNARTWELLMSPEEAHRLRRQQAALIEAAQAGAGAPKDGGAPSPQVVTPAPASRRKAG